jgi:hypothetical protein
VPSDAGYAIVWLFAFGSLFVPSFLAWSVSDVRSVFRWGMSICIVGLAVVCVRHPFAYPEGRPPNALWLEAQPALWAVGICVLGCIAGAIIRKRLAG